MSLPEINDLVDVILPDGAQFPSRVEDVDDRTLTVAAPLGLATVNVPPPGTVIELAWVGEHRRLAVDARLAGLTRQQPARWRLEPAGAAHLQTRRNYVRGGGGESVTLTHGNQSVTARIMDVSEGGVRCRLNSGVHPGPELGLDPTRSSHDEPVEVRLVLAGTAIALPANVLSVRQHPELECFEVVVTYTTDEVNGRLIRAHVLRREMEARRRLRESAANP